MPRQRRGPTPSSRSAPSRPTVAPSRPKVLPPQQRPASTTTGHPQGNAQKPQASQGPGLFGQMASTAAGVAVGSSIGHAIGGFFGGGSSQEVDAQPADSALASQSFDGSSQPSSYSGGCEDSATAFTRCLDENKGEHQMSICGWYLDQLKACQAAANRY